MPASHYEIAKNKVPTTIRNAKRTFPPRRFAQAKRNSWPLETRFSWACAGKTLRPLSAPGGEPQSNQPLTPTVRTPQCGHTVWGNIPKKIVQITNQNMRHSLRKGYHKSHGDAPLEKSHKLSTTSIRTNGFFIKNRFKTRPPFRIYLFEVERERARKKNFGDFEMWNVAIISWCNMSLYAIYSLLWLVERDGQIIYKHVRPMRKKQRQMVSF